MLVKTLKRHRYKGKLREQGGKYDLASEKHLKLLEAVGRVRRVPVVLSAPLNDEPKPKRKSVKKKATKKKTTKKKTGSTYKRKDMVAE